MGRAGLQASVCAPPKREKPASAGGTACRRLKPVFHKKETSGREPEGSLYLSASDSHSSRRSLYHRAVVFALLLPLLVLPLFAQDDSDAESWFSLTSQKTFLTGEKPEIAVNAHNVKQLEFRVYRVNDPVKFFSQMQELHNFGGQGPALPKQAHTWLEKFHAWKHRIWAWVRDFVRAQFSPDSRHEIRIWQMGGTATDQGSESRQLRPSSGAQPAAGRFRVAVDSSQLTSSGRA